MRLRELLNKKPRSAQNTINVSVRYHSSFFFCSSTLNVMFTFVGEPFHLPPHARCRSPHSPPAVPSGVNTCLLLQRVPKPTFLANLGPFWSPSRKQRGEWHALIAYWRTSVKVIVTVRSRDFSPDRFDQRNGTWETQCELVNCLITLAVFSWERLERGLI